MINVLSTKMHAGFKEITQILCRTPKGRVGANGPGKGGRNGILGARAEASADMNLEAHLMPTRQL